MEIFENLREPLTLNSGILNDSIDIIQSKKEGVYDPFQSPPNLKMAMNHGKAKRVYLSKPKLLSVSIVKRICPCCGLAIEGEPLPLCSKLSELYPIGSGYALYFKSVKYCIVLLGLIFITSGMFNLISNALGGDCMPSSEADQSSYCVQGFIMSYIIANKKSNAALLTTQMALNLVSLLTILFFFQFFHYKLRKTIVEADFLTVTPSDYTIKVTGILPEADEKEIRQWVESFADESFPIKCTKVNRTFHINKYVELQQKKDSLIIKKNEERDHINKCMIESDIDQLDREIEILRHQQLEVTGTVFISFENAQQAKHLVKKYKKTVVKSWLKNFTGCLSDNLHPFGGKRVSIKRAPEPTDVLWENQDCSPIERFKKVMVSRLCSILIIVLCFLVVVFISWGQNVVRSELGKQSTLILLLTILASYLVVTVNYALGMATRYLAERERHVTYTAYFTKVAKRLCASMFINTAFTTLLAKIFTLAYFGEFNHIRESLDPFNFYRKGGVLESMFYVFLSNAIVGPLYTMFNPFHFLKLYQRKKALRLGNDNTMTQQRAHTIFEGTQTDLSFKNAALAKTVLVAAFFAPAMPLALPISIAGLALSYWTDKFALLRRSALPTSLDSKLANSIMKIFEATGLSFALGNIVFMLTLEGNFEIEDYFDGPYGLLLATLIISIVYLFMPIRRINAILFPIPEETEECASYDDARVDFPSDYDIENPVTRREGLHNFVEFLKNKTKDDPHSISMSTSMKKGGFHSLFENHLKNLVLKNSDNESAEIKKKNEYIFLEEYATKKSNMNMMRQKSAREKTLGLDQLLGTTQKFNSEL